MKKKDDLLHTIAQNVYIRRKARHMSISSLTEASGVSKTQISNLENEHLHNVSINTLELLAGALKCDIISLLTPASEQEYASLKKTELDPEAECELSTEIYKTKLQKTYYPPLAPYNRISSFTELAVILPLLDLSNLYDNYFRILGQTIGCEEYVSSQFEYSWNNLPDSLAKRFAEKELHIIHEKRDGNTDFDIPYDDEYKAEYDAYKELITQKRELIHDIYNFMDKNCFSVLFPNSIANGPHRH